MKKYWHITWMLVVMLFTLAACSDDDENEIVIDEAWKEINLAAFDARLQDAKTDTSLFTINSESGNGQIICKILKKGEGTETIYYTSKVNCYYKGCFVTNEDGEVVADRDSVLTQGEVFDSRLRENGDDKVLFEVDDSGLRDGFATAYNTCTKVIFGKFGCLINWDMVFLAMMISNLIPRWCSK